MKTSNETLQIIRFCQGASNALNGRELLQARLTKDANHRLTDAGWAYQEGFNTVKDCLEMGYDKENLEVMVEEMMKSGTVNF